MYTVQVYSIGMDERGGAGVGFFFRRCGGKEFYIYTSIVRWAMRGGRFMFFGGNGNSAVLYVLVLVQVQV